ncbi:MAG: DUF1570 domain-containing protein [candidate division Zixibacteria bacterium]|nr:DUF1570 domain-containing protein [candidate division Zixibacteria bacterium]MDH3937093.1 DUF1570 domain-containing protein [candidate division Zixibacteria bacterium]MDH4032369.1 DUF1570 domain-containing protein [candidate division Zixibacteria bacterium]
MVLLKQSKSTTHCLVAIIVLLASVIADADHARGDSCTKSANEAWEGEQYKQTVELLADCRADEFGRNLDVDYMLATSYCRLPDTKDLGIEWFKWILDRYALDNTTKEIIESEMEECGKSTQGRFRGRHVRKIIAHIAGGRAAGIDYRGKTFFKPGVSPLRGSPPEFVDPRSLEELRDRIVPLRDSADALKRLNAVLGDSQDAAGSFKTEHFLVKAIGMGHISESHVAQVFEHAYVTLLRQFQVSELDSYINIYLATGPDMVVQLARDLHGLRVGNGTLGYSFRDDLCLVASVGYETEYLGTVVHELFHLMLRSSFGDVPPWLDEGLASLFEVSEYDGRDVIRGGRNEWRENVLNDGWEDRPPLNALVRMNWDRFDARGAAEQASIASLNQAYARYFLMYLQERGKLRSTYQAILRQTPDSLRPNESSGDLVARVLSESLDQSVDEAQQDFEQWYNTEIRDR